MSDIEKTEQEINENENISNTDPEPENRTREEAAGEETGEDLLIETTEEREAEDLEFISEDSVKDRSKMVEDAPIKDEFVTRKKTRRRGADEFEARKERSLGMFRRYIVLICIACVVLVVAICAIGSAVRKRREKQAAENTGKPVSAQEYEKDEHQEINDLIAAYYDAYAKGDTEAIQQYAYPMTDKEKSYIAQDSKFVEQYENITCYTKTGADDQSFIVSVAMEIRFKDVETTAPGLDFFYVRTSEDGKVYIDNTYSKFNLIYQETPLDPDIQKLITDYQAGEDVVALQASVQTQYEEALNKDKKLDKMVNETWSNAIADWESGQTAEQQQAQQAAEQQVQAEENAAAQQAAAEQQQAAQKEAAAKKKEKAAKKTVYVKETVRMRKKASTKSKVTATITKGAKLKQLAVTGSGWSKVKDGKKTGYIKSEYLTDKKPKKSKKSVSVGAKVYLTASVNIRKSMSESAERVGLAYSGETVKVTMVYESGWAGVKWKGKTGYVKTEVLADML